MTSSLPLIVVAMVVAGLILAVRLKNRVSMGSMDGGAWEAISVAPPGQRTKPWELEVVEQQVKWRSDKSGAPIVVLLNQLVDASSLDNSRYQLPPNAQKSQVELVVAELERETSLFREGTAK